MDEALCCLGQMSTFVAYLSLFTARGSAENGCGHELQALWCCNVLITSSRAMGVGGRVEGQGKRVADGNAPARDSRDMFCLQRDRSVEAHDLR